jgi:phospholipid/cholesterol/gamma-HCH transport system ATP-binding protein
MQTTVAKISHLKKSFGDKVVLKDICLELKKGENLVILGKSGSGKSVLIKCLVDLITPDEGEIELLGKSLANLKKNQLNELRKKIGFLFQSGALYDSMTVRENLSFPLRSSSVYTTPQLETHIEETLSSVGLLEAIDKMPSELSGGMRKRVGLARTLILKPEIILYDEPTTGLDPITSREISELILHVQSDFNAASIIITHDVQCARLTANRILVIKEGEVVAEGSFQELSESTDSWIRSFFQ